jgi:hypothetical protein
MALANVNLKFGINLESFRSGLQKVEKSLDATGKKMQQIGQNMSMYITLPVAAIGAASLKAASDAEETFSKFDTVFRDIQGSAETAFQTLRTEYGLSSTAAKQMLGDTGDLLTGFGFSQQGALDLSMEVQKLAVDLASFTNYSGGAKGASEALTKALLGEREQLKSLGIAIMEEDVKRQVALNTKNGIVHATDREAKAYATLQLALQQSGNAIGDYARTSGSFANQSRLLRERITDLSVELGSVFLPLATKIVSAVTGAVEWFSKLDGSIKAIIAVVAALAAAIGPLLIGFGFLVSNIIPMLKAGWVAVTAVMTPLVLKIAAITAAVAGLILVGKGVYDSWGTVSKFFGQMWEKIKLFFIQGVANTLKTFNKFTSIIGLDFSDTIAKMETDAKGIKAALDAEPMVSFGDVVSDIGKNIMNTFSSIKNSVMGTKEEVMNTNDELANAQASTAGGGGGGSGINRQQQSGISAAKSALDNSLKLPTQIRGISDRVREGTAAIYDTMLSFNNDINSLIGGSISGAFMNLAGSIGEAMATGGNIFAAVGKSILSSLGAFLGQLGKMMIEYGTMALVKAKLDASLAVPGAGFVTGPMAIAAGLALIALSSAIGSFASGKGKGGASSGGGALGGATSLPARAMGGSVQMGQPYLVGERGPELFTPSGFGSITNARSTAGMGMTQEIKVMVQGMLSGRDIYISGQEYLRQSGRTT